MKPRTIEAAFAEFCERCDPAAMAEVFDRAAPELLPLARRLTRGRSEADDLIQETFLAAIEHRESFDASRTLMPWLVGILVRQASSARRRSQRDIDPGRMASRSQSGPDEDAEAREFQRIVMEALGRLSSRDRAVLVPLLFDGKRAVQIARELGSRPDTIRMRIHRGLERLRQLLPAGFALPGFFHPGRGLNEVRAQVLRAAARHGAAPIAVPVAAGTSTGFGAVWLVLAFACSLLFLWKVAEPWLRSAPEVPGAEALVQPSTAKLPVRDVPDIDPTASREVAAAPVLPVPEPVLPADEYWLAGLVSGLQPADFAAAKVEVRGLGPQPIALSVGAELGAAGSYEVNVTRLARLGARRLLVLVDHPSYLPAQLRVELDGSPRVNANPIELQAARVVQGKVLAPDGTPAAGVRVGLYSLSPGNQDVMPIDKLNTRADGAFRLRAQAKGAYAVIAFREGIRPASRFIDLNAALVDLGALRLEAGLSIAGTLHAAPGVELEGTQLRCEAVKPPGERRLRLADRRFLRIGDSIEIATAMATCDAQGHFEFSGLGPQLCDIGVERMSGVDATPWDPARFGLFGAASAVRAPRFDLQLELPWSLFDLEVPALTQAGQGRFAMPEDFAVDIAMTAEPGREAGSANNLRLRPLPGTHTCLQVHPGASYDIKLRGCTSGGAADFTLVAPQSGISTKIPLEFNPAGVGAALVLELGGSDLAAAEPIGVGFFPIAAGAAAWERDAEQTSGVLFERNATLDPSNRVSFADLPAGLWRVQVRVGGTYARSFGFVLPAVLDVDLAPGMTSNRSVPIERGGRARMMVLTASGAQSTATARLFDAAGVEHALQLMALEPESAREEPGRVVLDAPNDFGPLRPGTWRMELSSMWHETMNVPFEIKLGEVTEFSVELKAR